MNLRLGHPTDASAVSRLMAATWRATYTSFLGAEAIERITSRWHTPEQMARQLADPDLLFLVAEDDDQHIVGHLAGKRRPDGIVDLRRLYIEPPAQGIGLGTRLYDAFEAALPNTHGVELEVFPQNDRAIAFYRRRGFAVVRENADCFGDGSMIAEWIMRRPPP